MTESVYLSNFVLKRGWKKRILLYLLWSSIIKNVVLANRNINWRFCCKKDHYHKIHHFLSVLAYSFNWKIEVLNFFLCHMVWQMYEILALLYLKLFTIVQVAKALSTKFLIENNISVFFERLKHQRFPKQVNHYHHLKCNFYCSEIICTMKHVTSSNHNLQRLKLLPIANSLPNVQ